MVASKTPSIVFPEWAPDQPTIGTEVAPEISGCVPLLGGYGPWRSPEEFTNALPGPCRGYYFARLSDGSIAIFAGTINRLYRLDNTTFLWVDVSQGGVPYGDLLPDANWKFRQFNDLVIAVQINTPPQKFILSSGTEFVDLGGNPPQASSVAIINRIVVLTGLLANLRRMQWSDLDAPEVWTAGVGLADFQDFPDGGSVIGVSGGDAYGLAFQEETIRTVVYDPGSSVTFQITRISTNESLYGVHSIIEVGPRTFFLTAQGFRMVNAGGPPQPIGKERVDVTFFKDVDPNNLQLIVGAADPNATRVYWSYKSKAGDIGLFDKVMLYDWALTQAGRWSLIPMSGQYIAALAKPGITLEALDDIAPGIVNVTNATDNGSGFVRLTFNELSNVYYSIPGQNFVSVRGVLGTVEANGIHNFTVSGPLSIDLDVPFVNAYISGGKSGGSLDALPFSLDSFSKAAASALSIFTPASKAAFFTGTFVEAVMETADSDLEGQMVEINGVRPITDSADAMVSIGMKMLPQSAISYSQETAINQYDGMCPALVETRYARGRLRIPAGSTWSYARSLQVDGAPAGEA